MLTRYTGWQLNQREKPVSTSALPGFKRPTIDDYAEGSRAAKKAKVAEKVTEKVEMPPKLGECRLLSSTRGFVAWGSSGEGRAGGGR